MEKARCRRATHRSVSPGASSRIVTTARRAGSVS